VKSEALAFDPIGPKGEILLSRPVGDSRRWSIESATRRLDGEIYEYAYYFPKMCLSESKMRYAKSPPARPWARLSENDHRRWWYAHLHELGAISEASNIEMTMRHRDLTPNLNIIGRFVVTWNNDQASILFRKAHWRYEEGLKEAKLWCRWAFHRHYMTTPFESSLRLVDDLNPGMFDEVMRSEKISTVRKAEASNED